jgi:hypothetical protein
LCFKLVSWVPKNGFVQYPNEPDLEAGRTCGRTGFVGKRIRARNGRLRQELRQELRPKTGIVPMRNMWDNGFRQMT